MKIFLLFLLTAFQVFAADIIQTRKELILKAFNAKPENLIAPLTIDDIELGNYEGRVVVNKKAKFTYYVHILNAQDPKSEITLIPMSTSRYTPTYYQTDDWWDAHKTEIETAKRNGTPQPRQDMNEVTAWLEEMKLTTNSDVVIIKNNRSVVRKPLQEFLFDIYIQKFVKNGKVVLYRGAERDNELQSWKSKSTPRGARYWTPTANYAWRYARKNKSFFDLLAVDETPLFKFEIPVNEFKDMVLRRWPRLTLGAELTKNAHQIFDRSAYFGDHLYNGFPFLGIGSVGLEFELRSNKSGADDMVKYFSGAVTIADLAEDRIAVLEATLERIKLQRPENFALESKTILSRIEIIKLEKLIVDSILNHSKKAYIDELLAKIPRAQQLEISNIDGLSFTNWAKNLANNPPKLFCKRFFN